MSYFPFKSMTLLTPAVCHLLEVEWSSISCVLHTGEIVPFQKSLSCSMAINLPRKNNTGEIVPFQKSLSCSMAINLPRKNK
jgi:hypothetical protein